MDNSSGVGVLDKAALVLAALEAGPATLAGLVAATGLARPTAHRLAVALEHHRLVARDTQGRFVLGPRLARAGLGRAGEDRLLATAGPVLARLRDITGESAQLYRRQGDAPRLRRRGRAGQRAARHRAGRLAAADAAPARPPRSCWPGRTPSGCTAACRTPRSPRPRWPRSAGAAGRSRVGEREPGVASVSAPVRSPGGKIIAAVSVSGPIERLTRQPGRMHAPAVLAAAERLSESLRRAAAE